MTLPYQAGGSPSGDGQVPQSAHLELIHETVHPEVLPAIPHGLHRRGIGDVRDLSTLARLDDLRQHVKCGDALEIECASERVRKPAHKKGCRFRLRRAQSDHLSLHIKCQLYEYTQLHLNPFPWPTPPPPTSESGVVARALLGPPRLLITVT